MHFVVASGCASGPGRRVPARSETFATLCLYTMALNINTYWPMYVLWSILQCLDMLNFFFHGLCIYGIFVFNIVYLSKINEMIL